MFQTSDVMMLGYYKMSQVIILFHKTIIIEIRNKREYNPNYQKNDVIHKNGGYKMLPNKF